MPIAVDDPILSQADVALHGACMSSGRLTLKEGWCRVEALFRVNMYFMSIMGKSSDEVACSGRRAPACPSGRLVVVGFAYSTLSVYGSPGKHVTILYVLWSSYLSAIMSDSRCQVHCNTPALTALQALRSRALRDSGARKKGSRKGSVISKSP